MEPSNTAHLQDQLSFLDMLRLAAQFEYWLNDPVLAEMERERLVIMIQDLLTAAKEVGPGWQRPKMDQRSALVFLADQIAVTDECATQQALEMD